MPRQTATLVMTLEALYWAPDPLRDQDLSVNPCVWPVFFKIDGSTAQVSDQPETLGRLIGTATVIGTTGTGRIGGSLAVNGSLAIPPEIGQWMGQVQPIPVGPLLNDGTDIPGIFGIIAVVLDPGGLEADALEAGHSALNESVLTALNNLIAGLRALQQDISQSEIDAAVKAVGEAVHSAIVGALDFWDGIKEKFFDLTTYGNVLAYYTQDQLPPYGPNQEEFSPTFTWALPGVIGVNGAFAQSRRNVGQGILSHFGSGVLAVAGYADDTFQHAIVATQDGNVTEIWWQGSGGVGQGQLSHFGSSIVALAAYYSGDGFQNVIVATNDRDVSQLWWQGSGAVGRGVLAHMNSPITALAGYYAEDYHSVIVATQDGNVSQLWWQGSAAPGQGVIAHFDSAVVDMCGYAAADGYEHVFVATKDGMVTELYWQGAAAASQGAQLQLEAYAWNSVLGVGGYYASADKLQHVIVGTSNGTLREFFWSPGDGRGVLHDDLANVSGMKPIIDSYYDPSGYQHAIVATNDGNVHELYWTARLRFPDFVTSVGDVVSSRQS